MAGKIFELDESKIYFLNFYNGILKKKIKNQEELNSDLFLNKVKNKQIKSLLDSKFIVKYIYNLLKNKASYKEISTLYYIAKKETLVAIES